MIGENIANYVGAEQPEYFRTFPGVETNVLEDETTAVSLDLKGSEAGNILRGGALNDTLEGRGGDDVLSGGGGNDTLKGGPDADPLNVGIMPGGPEKDQFWASTGSDVITYKDFNHKEGSLWLPEDTEGRFNAWANTTILTYLNGTLALEGVNPGPDVPGPDGEVIEGLDVAKNYAWLDCLTGMRICRLSHSHLAIGG